MSGLHAPSGMPAPVPPPDFEAVKARQQAIWASGDFGQIGVRLQIVGESLCEAVDVNASDKVLDVAAGNGNASLAAARRYADVTSTDYVPELLEQGRVRAEADRLPIAFQVADAENLPFGDASFDVVLSTFGVMFAPNQARAAAEMVRVLKPGGRIGMANWTPDGFVGQMFRLVARFNPPPPGVPSAALWGTDAWLQDSFGSRASDIRIERKYFVFRYRSPEHWVEVFRAYFGPIHKTFAALDADRQDEFRDALLDLLRRANRNGHEALAIPAEYLEIVVTR